MTQRIVQVAVGVIVNSNDEVLISKRSASVHQANCWEFPGGKIEKDETVENALARELEEELGIHISASDFLKNVNFDYGEKRVCLSVYIVNEFSGTPTGLEGQPVQWVKVSDLNQYKFPEANISIINILQLPQLIQITGDFTSLRELLDKVKVCIDKGISIIQFRAHHLNDSDYRKYADQLLELCHQKNVKLILNRTPELLELVAADGLHLNRHEINKYDMRPCPLDKIFSVSCHNEAELNQAEKLSADYCLLSPVKKAISHDAGLELGMKKFSDLIKASNVPVYALGGMASSDVHEIVRSGGRGVATVSEFWL